MWPVIRVSLQTEAGLGICLLLVGLALASAGFAQLDFALLGRAAAALLVGCVLVGDTVTQND